MPKLREECGVFGVWGHPEAANIACLGLHALQHRGQESCGIASSDGRDMYCMRGMGRVADVFTADNLRMLPGTSAIGHVRYSTAGDSTIENAQPLVVTCNKGKVAISHNGNLTNARAIRRLLGEDGCIFQTTSDTEVILHLVARSGQKSVEGALQDAMRQLEGAFSIVVLDEHRIIAARDSLGFRPLAVGVLDVPGELPAHVFASETSAFDLIGASYITEVWPGEMVIADACGIRRERYAASSQLAQCAFEHVYFSRPDSVVFGRSVEESRETLGRLLAREHPVAADMVVPVPDSGVSAAVGYANESGIPFRMGLIRSHYVGRTFIEPEQAIRDLGVKLKLNPVRSMLNGKRVILVDDSIVRGTTSRKIVRLVRHAGAKEIHLRITCPPTVSPCYYGIDMPTKEELIAANKSVEDIRTYLEADTLCYLSLEALREAVGDKTGTYCYACWTGRYPTRISIEEIASSKKR